MRAGLRRVIVSIVVVSAAVLSVAVAPQVTLAGPDSLATGFGRQVGPHRFPGELGVPTPFLSSYVGSGTGLATTSGMKAGLYNFDQPPLLLATKGIQLSYLIQEFDFQRRVSHDVAVRLVLSGSGRLGTDTAALLTEGISAIVGWAAGATIRLSERPDFKLSGSLDASGNSLTIVSVRDLVEDIRANGLSDTTRSLSHGESNLLVTTGLRAAWGHSLTTGYMLYGDVGLQEPYDESKSTKFYWRTGGMVSLDMRERWGPDVGFTLGASYHSHDSRDEDIVGRGWSTSLGILYTGRPEFTAGLQSVFTRAHQIALDNDLSVFGFALVLRYDFS